MGKPGDGPLCIVEGFATGATIHEATGYPVAVAGFATNLLPVAQSIRGKLPDILLVVCADDDHATPGNPGRRKGTEAAATVGGVLALPDFGLHRPAGATDFNDLARLRGHKAVVASIEAALSSLRGEGGGHE